MAEAGSSRPVDVSRSLRQAILRGDYPFGSRLKINDIAQRFGVSHMPVRKALLQLEGERLVRTEPNRGASVRSVDVEFVGNTYDVVIPLEALLARRAAGRMTNADLARLGEIETVLEEAAGRGDHDRVYELNSIFHRLINDAAGNAE
ncbi:MAG: GntR family transcriptional regulator, partial [Acetobacteraceae bacterium]|nr:GntR family transcriptional regulator [Acetobacteraceae bacterium]